MGMGMMMGGAGGDLATEVKTARANFWGNVCCCFCPALILLIVLSSLVGWMTANAKIFYAGFNWPYYPGMEMEGAVYLCGMSYDNILEDLYDDYYRQPLSFGDIWSTDLYVELTFYDLPTGEAHSQSLMALQDKVTNHYHHPYNASFDVSGDRMTVGANLMGVLPFLDLEDESIRQFWVAMNRAEAWCRNGIDSNADINMLMYAGASAEDVLEGTMPALELLGEGFMFGVENDLPGGMLEVLGKYYVEEYLKDQDDYRLVDIERLHENVPYSLLYAQLFTGINFEWDKEDVETVAQHPSFINQVGGLRAYVDRLLTVDTYDSAALDTAGYVAYKSAYVTGGSQFENFIDDDEDTNYDYDRGDLEDLQWMNYQMEFYGIMDALLNDLDKDNCEIEVRWALPVSAVNAAGEMWMESDGLGQLLHAIFKVFWYYPFDREFH